VQAHDARQQFFGLHDAEQPLDQLRAVIFIVIADSPPKDGVVNIRRTCKYLAGEGYKDVDYTLWVFGKSETFDFNLPKQNLRRVSLLGSDFGAWLTTRGLNGRRSEVSQNLTSHTIDPLEPPILLSDLLKLAIDITTSRGRSVWMIVEPLKKFKVFGTTGTEPFCHWGILVSGLTRRELEERKRQTASSSADPWGTRHELRNNEGQNEYQGETRYYASDLKSGSQLTYLGQTEMLDVDLREYGISHP
jgi:hypothetical protein